MIEKLSLIPWKLRVPIWKINYCSNVFRLSELPRSRERPQTTTCFEWLVPSDWFELNASLSILSASRRFAWNRSSIRLPVSAMFNFFNKCKLCNRWHWQRYTWSDQWGIYIITTWQLLFLLPFTKILPSIHPPYHTVW